MLTRWKRVAATVAVATLLTIGSIGLVAKPAYADDDYPSKWRDVAQDSIFDDWGEYNRECTSWVAWALHNRNEFEMPFHGDAKDWSSKAATAGYITDTSPAPGAVAWWAANAPGGSASGHVAYVEWVSEDGRMMVSQYNLDFTGHYSTTTFGPNNSGWPTGYIHFRDLNLPKASATASTTDQQFGGDYNGDGFGDTALVHQNGGGADIHVLYGSTGTPFQYSPTFATRLPWPTWDWNKLKVVSGRFNSDRFADLAVFYQRADGGMDVHVFYGGTYAFTTWAPVRNLPGSAGWSWANTKLVSGDFNGDNKDDVALGTLLADGGMGVHVLYGGVGTPFQNAGTSVRTLRGNAGWNWHQTKLAAGMFNNDGNADLALITQGGDGGIVVHLLVGATGGTPFQNQNTWQRTLPGSSGWSWAAIKVAAGAFNSDSFADIALLHRLSDGGIGVHVLYGGVSPFQNGNTVRVLLGYPDGWSWAAVKLAAGRFNADPYSDVVLLHQLPNNGIHAHVLYGAMGTPFVYSPTLARDLPSSAGWAWSLVKVA